jgi:hypothetical protein
VRIDEPPPRHRRRRSRRACAAAVTARDAARQPYTEVRYQSGGLSIQGYFYQPDGSGPFPTLIYNHGSRAGFERRPIPWVRLAALYVAAGYAAAIAAPSATWSTRQW